MHNHDPSKIKQEEIEQIIKNRAMRRNLTQACHFWFFHIYFPHHIGYQSSAFHKELFELTEDERKKNVIVEAYRGSGKTTIMGMSYAIWSILGCQKRKFILILAQTESQARQYLANIKMELEMNELLHADLGPFEEPDDEWRATSIVLKNYGARITVASIDKAIRGIKHRQHRPDLIICDDLENLDIVKTQESRDKTFNWLMGDVIPLGDKNTRLIVIGTRLHNDSIIMRLKVAMRDGVMDGIARAYPFFDENNKVMWPEKYKTEAEVETVKKGLPSIQAWEREYMLNIISTDEQVVRPEWIQHYNSFPPEDPSSCFRYSATGVDPAISEESTADFTAMVSARVYGRKNNLKIYILPNPINERMDFPKTTEIIKSISRTLGNGSPTIMWIEGVAYQKALIDQLQSEGYPAKEYKPQGTDKRARLSLTSSLIQSGKIVFPRKGAEHLITQITGFGTERHDDLSDAFCILVLSILGQESRIIKGYYPLIYEKDLESAYIDSLPPIGERRLGVVLAGGNRNYSAIVFRAKNVAKVLYYEMTDDITIIATKVIELAKEHNVLLSDNRIFIDKVGSGQELCERIKQYVTDAYQHGAKDYRQYYGINMGDAPLSDKERYVNHRARTYWRLAEWIKKGGKLLGRPIFDDLLSIVYTEQPDTRIRIIDKEKLMEEGIDSSIPDALALTIVTDKEREYQPYIEEKETPFWV